jgi:hypothetical protein
MLLPGAAVLVLLAAVLLDVKLPGDGTEQQGVVQPDPTRHMWCAAEFTYSLAFAG